MSKQKGYTLVELLVALAIGVVIMFGVTTTFVGSLQTSAATIRTEQFDQEMRAAMNLITRDLKRGGYSAKATDDVGKTTYTNYFLKKDVIGNPAEAESLRLWSGTTGTTELAMYSATIANCVTYSYDIDKDGVVDQEEFLGFKWNTTGTVVYKRTGLVGGAMGQNCTVGTWSALTSDDLIVDNLSFQWQDYTNLTDVPTTLTPSPSGCTGPQGGDNTKIGVRVVQVVFTAHSTKDSKLKRTLTDYVKMRNNIYDPCGN